MTTFTPGPWEIEAGFLITRAHTGVGSPIVQLFDPSGEAGFICGTRSEAEANARLIAAAPDLLEALQDAVIDQLGDNWRSRARAAIAKALHPSAADTSGENGLARDETK